MVEGGLAKEIQAAADHFGHLLAVQASRVARMKETEGPLDYGSLDPLIIGICGGDGIGPFIAEEAQRVLAFLLEEELARGRVVLQTIEGLTIERRAAVGQAIPADVLEALKACHVILKGPTTTPRKGDPWPNIESANVAMRRELDLYANIRPVRVPEEGIDWTFFRENTEGEYILGSQGVEVGDDITVDFKVITTQGARRIIHAAFAHASKTGRNKVTVVTKANVVKTTDGRFLSVAREVARDYPDVEWDDWYIDIMAAKLIDPARRTDFKVLVLPNLYGDILTDQAAQFQGGVGTAGSANVGDRYAMFEAIHGSAPRMVEEGRAQYADPSSMIRAAAMLLEHVGFTGRARRLTMALDVCGQYERRFMVTGRDTGATGADFADYLMETLQDDALEERYRSYSEA